jgi:spermidine synthase
MQPWIELSQARTAAGDTLVLRQRGGIFEIRCNGWDLMSNRAHHSEETAAALACAPLTAPAPRVLIGGLGMGYTLRAALDRLPATARVIVAELLPAVIAWNRGPLAPLAGHPLDDPRVAVMCGDVAVVLEQADRFDAIVLDADNGPDAVMLAGNQRLYSCEGLRVARQRLCPGGTLAVWSADRSPGFERRLAATGFEWRSTDVPARGDPADPHHIIYLASAAPDR